MCLHRSFLHGFPYLSSRQFLRMSYYCPFHLSTWGLDVVCLVLDCAANKGLTQDPGPLSPNFKTVFVLVCLPHVPLLSDWVAGCPIPPVFLHALFTSPHLSYVKKELWLDVYISAVIRMFTVYNLNSTLRTRSEILRLLPFATIIPSLQFCFCYCFCFLSSCC